jgi:hypothetical protein
VVLPAVVPSDAATVEEPVAAVGMVNAQVLLAGRLPLASVVQVPDVLSAVPSNVTVIVRFGLKLLPLSVTVPPAAPALGFRLMAGVMVYFAAAELP